ncbi:MAG: hypothetical protein RL764_1873 [Pseudomonadota bacterium]
MLLLLTLAMGVATPPKPGELRSFEDWSVGCDNGRSCTAVSLMEVETNENQLTLQIVRSGAPNAPAQLRIPNIEQRTPNMRVALVRNDATVLAQATLPPEGQTLTISLDTALAHGLAKGRFVTLQGPMGERLGRASLRGVQAALQFVDAQQGRTNSVTALASPGPAPVTSLSPPPPLPAIVPTRPPRAEAFDLSAADVEGLQARTGCELTDQPALPARAVRIDRRTWLALLPCSLGSYNIVTSPILITGSGKGRRMKPAEFDFGPGFSQTDGVPLLSNATWDAQKGELASFSKGRGLGDCGSAETYVWDGRRFRLTYQIAMAECRGVLDWIPVWRAEVRRR